MANITELLTQFTNWMAEAEKSEINDPNAMSVATVGPDGMPSLRMVLLKKYDERGFVFYTNLESQKGTEILQHSKVALNVYWKSIRKQVRISGHAEQIPDAEADEYFATRPYDSKVGAHASQQSRPLTSYSSLIADAAKYSLKYKLHVPRPVYWSGFRIKPITFEFWSAHTFKLHERIKYTLGDDGSWSSCNLYP